MYVLFACCQLATLSDDQSILLLSSSPIIKVVTNLKQVRHWELLVLY